MSVDRQSVKELLTPFHIHESTKPYIFKRFQDEDFVYVFSITSKAPKLLVERTIFEIFKAKGSRIEHPIVKYINAKNEIVPFDKLKPEGSYLIFITERTEFSIQDERNVIELLKIENLHSNDYLTVMTLREYQESQRITKEIYLVIS